MTYQYINPTEKGFIRVPVTRRQHNKLLPNRKRRFGVKVEYYWKAETRTFEAQYLHYWWMKVCLTVFMTIPAVIMQGLPETARDIGNLVHERKRGKFSADRSFLRDERDSELLEFITKQVGGKRG